MNEGAVLAFLEAIYALDRDDQTWLARALDTTQALFGHGHTYLGYFYDASDMQAFNVWNVRSLDQPPEVGEAFQKAQLTVGPELLMATLRSIRVGSIRRNGMPHVAPLFSERERVGWGDIFIVNGLDPSGIGCLLTVGTRAPEFSPTKEEMVVYSRLAQHVATAFRCRRLLGILRGPGASQSEPEHAKTEAVLDDDGRFVHAQGEAATAPARERIRAAAQAMAALRESGSASGRATLEGWRPLVNARWTLVDTFEENGRRYVLARENQARSGGLDRLTDRERQVVLQATLGHTNKEIAYALGLSNSTVRVLMARAAARFGVRTRVELLSHPSLRELHVSVEAKGL